MNTMDGVNNGYIAGLSGELIESYLQSEQQSHIRLMLLHLMIATNTNNIICSYHIVKVVTV